MRLSKYRHDRIKWHMSRNWSSFNENFCSNCLHLGEINKHMQDLSAEFEDLFDPYLPVASKLKMKSCPGLGVKVARSSRDTWTLCKKCLCISDYRVLRRRPELQSWNSFVVSRQMEGKRKHLGIPLDEKKSEANEHFSLLQIKVGVNDTVEMTRDDKSISVNFDIME